MENIPIVEDRPSVELVEDLAEHEGVEQDATRPENKRGGGGPWYINVCLPELF